MVFVLGIKVGQQNNRFLWISHATACAVSNQRDVQYQKGLSEFN